MHRHLHTHVTHVYFIHSFEAKFQIFFIYHHINVSQMTQMYSRFNQNKNYPIKSSRKTHLKHSKKRPHGSNQFLLITRAAPDSRVHMYQMGHRWTAQINMMAYNVIDDTTSTMPREPHKLMTFQHGCPHHCIPPGGMYFLNTSKRVGKLNTFDWLLINRSKEFKKVHMN